MIEPSPGPKRAPLGVGTIVGQSFSILFRQLPRIVVLGGVPSLALALLYSRDSLLVPLNNLGMDFRIILIADKLFVGACTALQSALLIQLVLDVAQNQTVRMGRYILPALKAIVPITFISVLPDVMITLLRGSSIAALYWIGLVTTLWLHAVLYMGPTAMVAERMGLGGVRRNWALSKHYRWSLIGFIMLILICKLLFAFIMIAGGLGFASFTGVYRIIGIKILVGTIGTALTAISATLAYLRLREIKEGSGLENVANVFD